MPAGSKRTIPATTCSCTTLQESSNIKRTVCKMERCSIIMFIAVAILVLCGQGNACKDDWSNCASLKQKWTCGHATVKARCCATCSGAGNSCSRDVWINCASLIPQWTCNHPKIKEMCCVSCNKAPTKPAACKDGWTNCASLIPKWTCDHSEIKKMCCASCGNKATKPKSSCKDGWTNCADLIPKWTCDHADIKKMCCASCGGSSTGAGAKPAPTKKTTFANKGLNQDEINACVKSENDFRRMHEGTNPLQWDNYLAQEAQKYANHLLAESYRYGRVVMEHENPDRGMGENLYYGDQSRAQTCIDANKSWYNKEEKNYNYQTGRSNGGVINHFTQMVWKGTTKFGVGVASGKSIKYASYGNILTFVVAKYQPKGNWIGDYTKNVGRKTH